MNVKTANPGRVTYHRTLIKQRARFKSYRNGYRLGAAPPARTEVRERPLAHVRFQRFSTNVTKEPRWAGNPLIS